MASTLIKIALLTGVVVLTLGVIPNRRWCAVVAITSCVAAAFVLHFAAP